MLIEETVKIFPNNSDKYDILISACYELEDKYWEDNGG